MRRFVYGAIVVVTALAVAPVRGETPETTGTADWKAELQRQLPLLGHRNWIVVADSAYPAQTAPGIKTVCTGRGQIEVVRTVLAAVDKANHVRGVVFLDAELPHVPEQSAAGVSAYRRQLTPVLEGHQPVSLPHEQIIAKLDEAGKTFHVLLLKTDLTIPYTSVFLRLDCGYWSDEAEQGLRKAMQQAGGRAAWSPSVGSAPART